MRVLPCFRGLGFEICQIGLFSEMENEKIPVLQSRLKKCEELFELAT
jgi:hypothetical protein